MVAAHQPTVFVGGLAIAGATLGAGLLPLADIGIEWGRPDLYAPPTSATIRVGVIDESGGWATNNALVGKELRLERDGGIVMFRGTVTAVSLATLKLAAPDGTVHKVFLARLEASCRLADLEMAVVPGPGHTGEWNTSPVTESNVYGLDHWPLRFSTSKRLADVLTASAGLISSLETDILATHVPELASTPGYTSRVLFSEQRSLLWLLAAAYNQIPLSTVNYVPATNGVVVGLPAKTTGLALALTGTTITLAPVAGKVLPAATLMVDDEAPLRSTVTNAISTVVVEWFTTGFATYNAEGEYFEKPLREAKATAHRLADAPALANRTLRVPTSATQPGTAFNPARAANIAALTAAAVAGVNGQFTMPPVTFDFRRFTPATPAMAELLLSTYQLPTALYLLGSKFNGLPNIGPQFQIIGGTLQWRPQAPGSHLEAGWAHTLTLAPTVGRNPSLTVAQLATTSEATLADFDPNITLADLGHLTIGLS